MRNFYIHLITISLCFSGYASAQYVQQGEKLTLADTAGGIFFGTSCALSADGTTAIIGAPGTVSEDRIDSGGAYVFTRSNLISYQIPQEQRVSLKIYDMLGREVKTLVDEIKPAGSYSAEFRADGLASGMYIYEIRTNNFTSQRKMMVVK